jgi:D-methionine transport system substrate-binding protein
VEKVDNIAAKRNENIICVREKYKEAEFAKVLVNALKSKEVVDFINSKYEGSVLPSNN